ncbi:hypothetical protein ElyMa_004070900 [Elysia marginata]|uniref:Uncharacterized protein n=1 Tax=Elysia marginata TaxID=1093978 RepID=A0AAV4G7K1_9GAST|nr:hypothetical protein ElyMa_004070900 [Elysia marginata]
MAVIHEPIEVIASTHTIKYFHISMGKKSSNVLINPVCDLTLKRVQMILTNTSVMPKAKKPMLEGDLKPTLKKTKTTTLLASDEKP